MENQNIETPKEELKQKSFKMDSSKEGNRRTVFAIVLLVAIRLLGPYIGYVIAGALVAALLYGIDYYITKNK